jgi:hypothetical protein
LRNDHLTNRSITHASSVASSHGIVKLVLALVYRLVLVHFSIGLAAFTPFDCLLVCSPGASTRRNVGAAGRRLAPAECLNCPDGEERSRVCGDPDDTPPVAMRDELKQTMLF